jgi:hypothetical protein
VFDFKFLHTIVILNLFSLRLTVSPIACFPLLYVNYRSNRQIKSHGQKIALRISQGENVLEELDALDASAVLQEGPGRTSDAATTQVVRNSSTRSIAIASPQIQQPDAHPQTSSSAMRNERPPVESPSNSIGRAAVTEAASVAWMLCELKTAKATTMILENSSAFVTPSVP